MLVNTSPDHGAAQIDPLRNIPTDTQNSPGQGLKSTSELFICFTCIIMTLSQEAWQEHSEVEDFVQLARNPKECLYQIWTSSNLPLQRSSPDKVAIKTFPPTLISASIIHQQVTLQRDSNKNQEAQTRFIILDISKLFTTTSTMQIREHFSPL